MYKNQSRNKFIGAVILIVLTALITFIGTSMFYLTMGRLPFYGIFDANSENAQYAKINQVRSIIDKYYIESIESEEIVEGAARGVAAALDDPYTVYMDKNEFDDFMTQTQGSYAGIGVVVSVDPSDNLITVIAPFEDTPGERAGILPGDKIIRVNDKDVSGDDLEEAVSMMKGPKKTEVAITILREGLTEPKEISVERDIIVLQTIKYNVMDDQIGYIRLTMFDEKTSDDFNAALDELYSKNIKGLIIDVRDNPGGLLEEVVKVADRLVPEGKIVYTENRSGEQNIEYSDKEEIHIPLAILINGGSASASEILSGSVKDHEKGILVGTKTFGKGLVQQLFPLGDGSAIKVTVSKYFTPNGICIQDIGIEPDIKVELPEEHRYKTVSQIEPEEDVQLQEALKAIRNENLS